MGDWLTSTANGLIGGTFNMIGAAQQRKFDERMAHEQQAWNEQMMDKQNDWSLNMWNKTNEYNSPTAQLQRLQDAGLNPLFYGLDGQTANGMQSAQALGYERASSKNFENPLSAGLAGALQTAQIANIQAQTQKTKTETQYVNAKLPYEIDSLKSQIRQSNASAEAQETINKYIDAQQDAELRLKNASVDQAEAAVKKSVAEIEKMDYEKTTMFIGWLETREKILTLQKQRELTDKQIEELASLIRVNNATAAKIGLDIKNYDDITVIGVASSTMKIGPFTVQEGEPITLGMKKAAEQHKKDLEDKQEKEKKKKKVNDNGQVSATAGSVYTGPIYD